MASVEFEPTQLALVELDSTPLDHLGKVSCVMLLSTFKLLLEVIMQSHAKLT